MNRSVTFARQADIMEKHGFAPPLREQLFGERTAMPPPRDQEITLDPQPVPSSQAITPPHQGNIGKAPVGQQHDLPSARR